MRLIKYNGYSIIDDVLVVSWMDKGCTRDCRVEFESGSPPRCYLNNAEVPRSRQMINKAKRVVRSGPLTNGSPRKFRIIEASV